MDQNGGNTEDMIRLRRQIHQHPEGGFAEHITQKLLADTLVSFGLDRKLMKNCAGTGLVVDIMGSGPVDKAVDKGCKLVAFRADMDGLPMPENNQSLPYKS